MLSRTKLDSTHDSQLHTLESTYHISPLGKLQRLGCSRSRAIPFESIRQFSHKRVHTTHKVRKRVDKLGMFNAVSKFLWCELNY